MKDDINITKENIIQIASNAQKRWNLAVSDFSSQKSQFLNFLHA